MKKIAIFQRNLDYGGIQKSVINLLNNIDYKKYEIDLYLMKKENVFIGDLNPNVNVYYLKSLPYIFGGVPFPFLKIIYKKQVQKEYDIAINFDNYDMSTAIMALKTKAKEKIIWLHNDMYKEFIDDWKFDVLYFAFQFKFRYFDHFVCVSQGVLDSFQKLKPRLKNKKYDVIPNIIDTKEIIKKSREKINLEIDKSKYNLCTLGRMCVQKGFDILLDDIKKLTELRQDFHLYIMGDGHKRKQLEKQMHRLHLEEYVTFLGYTKNPYAIMKEMDGFVLTSRYEGQGMVFLEAKCLGLDVVMLKHLEKYIDGVKGTTDVVKCLSKLEKHKKKTDDLKEYNQEIIKKIDKLFK